MSESRPTADPAPPLGRCPLCHELLPASRLLIRYETTDGWPKLFAACPTCVEVVHPV